MIIATWNVNSVRAREARLLSWLSRNQPDVLCLQELKVADEGFPLEQVQSLGYQVATFGQQAYNGVAILSKAPLEDVRRGLGANGGFDQQARLISGLIGGIRVISAYFPNGQVVGSEKWSYKLDWMKRLVSYLGAELDPGDPIVLCGDCNVAPEDRDVARPDEWRESVLCHAAAREALAGVTQWGFTDAVRLFHEGPGPYSWWDYRLLGFPKGNGLRIDHIFVTQPLVGRCVRAWIDRDERKGKLPSDHAPVLVEL